jgi:hypothetical protein
MAIRLAADFALKHAHFCSGEPYGAAENILASSAAEADAD